MKNPLYSLLPLLLFSCSVKADYPDLAYRIVRRQSKEVKTQYGFDVFGTGGSMRDAVNSVFISYSSNRKVDIAAARILYVDIAEALIEKFNDDEEIRPFLANYPFTSKNIELDLCFFEPNGGRYKKEYISYVFMVKDIIYYSIHDPKITDNNPLVIIHEEPYEEALRIVSESRKQASASIHQ